MNVRLILLGLTAVALSGCQTTGPVSIKGGECRIFERPEYAVLGKRQYDQNWIDSQIEGGVGGCRWKRPLARPAALDAVQGQRVVVQAPVKKKGIIRRIKDRVVSPFSSNVAPVIASPPLPVVEPVPVPRPQPRDPVDELLQPIEPIKRVR